MTQIFRRTNYPDENLLTGTVLIEDAASGQKIIDIVGSDDIVHGDIGVIGTLGSLVGEFAQVDVVTASTLQMVANLINDHRKTEPFTKIFGNQIKMYRVANSNDYPPPDSDFVLQSATTLDFDSPDTLITDNSGGAGFWYKFTFFNTFTSAETPLSESEAIRGYDYGHYCDIDQIRLEAGLQNNKQITDEMIGVRRDQAESEVKGALLASDYTLPLTDNNNQPYTPKVIENVTRILSAAYVLLQDYGPQANNDTKDGDLKMQTALGILTEIQDHTIILADIDEKQMSTALRVKGTPDNHTATAGNDVVAGNPPEPPFFTVSKIW